MIRGCYGEIADPRCHKHTIFESNMVPIFKDYKGPLPKEEIKNFPAHFMRKRSLVPWNHSSLLVSCLFLSNSDIFDFTYTGPSFFANGTQTGCAINQGKWCPCFPFMWHDLQLAARPGHHHSSVGHMLCHIELSCRLQRTTMKISIWNVLSTDTVTLPCMGMVVESYFLGEPHKTTTDYLHCLW